jgi:hypothetical protein
MAIRPRGGITIIITTIITTITTNIIGGSSRASAA